MEWLTVGQICKKIDMAESTVRRYLQRFEDFIRSEQLKNMKKYHQEALQVLYRASELYSKGLATEEVRKHLKDEFTQHIDMDHHPTATPDHNTTTNEIITVKEIYNTLEGMVEEVQELKKTINEQQDTIKEQQRQLNERLERRDQELIENIRELQEQKKPWWNRILKKLRGKEV